VCSSSISCESVARRRQLCDRAVYPTIVHRNTAETEETEETKETEETEARFHLRDTH